MARRRSLNRRRSRGSMNASGILNDDTNVFEDDNELWYKRIPDESNISKYRRSGSSRYSKSILNPDSGVIEGLDDDDPYWELLDKTDPSMLPRQRPGPSSSKSARKSNIINETLTSESSTIPPPKKRKLVALKSRKSTGDVFSQALDDSEPAIESEPVRPSNRHVQDPRQSLSQSEIADQVHRSGFQSSESENDRRAKRTIFKKPRRTSAGTSRVSLYEKVLDETDVSAVGPSQPSDDRRTFVKPRSTFSNSPRYNSQSKSNLSQQSSIKSKDGDGTGTGESDSDLDLRSQQRPRFRQHAAQSGDPFASIISETRSEKEVSQTQKSLDQSGRSIQSESRRKKKLRSGSPEIEESDESENDKSLTSGGSKSNSKSRNNFVLRESAGEHSGRQSRGKNSLGSRALSVYSDISENKSSTTSISETFKSIENLPSNYENNSQDFETIGEVAVGEEPMEVEVREEPMEAENPADQVLDPSQSQETFKEDTAKDASQFRASDFDKDEDEEVVDKENRESLNNLEEDVNVSQGRKSSKKSVTPVNDGKKIRQSSEVIIAGQQEKEVLMIESTEKRKAKRSEGDLARKSSPVQVEKKKSLRKKSHSRRISEVENLTSEIEVDKSLNRSARKTRSGRFFEDLETGTPEKSLRNKSSSRGKRSKSKINEEVEVEAGVNLEKSLTDSQRKTRSGRIFKEFSRGNYSGDENESERSRRMLEEGKKIQRRIFGEDSESEDEAELPEKVTQVGEATKRLGEKDHSQRTFDDRVENQETGKSLGGEGGVSSVAENLEDVGGSRAADNREDDKEVSEEVENQEGDVGVSQGEENWEGDKEVSREVENQESDGEDSEKVENQEDDEKVSEEVENQDSEEEEEDSQQVKNQKGDDEITPEVENQEDEEESLESEEEETREKTPERQEKEISRIESVEEESKLISKRKSKLGSPKHSSTRYINKDKSLDKSVSEEIDEEFDKYVRNTSKLSSLANKSKQREINPSPNDLPFRESDAEDDNLGEVDEATAVPKPSEARPSTSGIRTVNKDVESMSRESKQPPSNQRSILSFFSNTTTRPSLHISTKPLASADVLKEVDAKMKEIKKRRDESFAKQMEEEMAAKKAKPVKIMPVKKKRVGVSLVKKDVKAKEVDKAYIVNGVVYRKPRLPRPKHWATDRLYKFLWKKMEPKYDLQTRIKSEKFVTELAKAVEFIKGKKEYRDYKFVLEELLKKMAQLGIIVTRKDFYDFCYDFLPYEFREKVTPMLLPGAIHIVPFEPAKLSIPILEG